MKIFKKILPALIIVSIVALLCGFVALVIHESNKRHSPLWYCIWEIHKHEDYDCEFTYYHQELEPKYEIMKEANKNCELYAYYITVFTDDRKGEWYCFIETKRSIWKNYLPKEVMLIDCDLAIETFFGSYGEED